MRVCGKAVVHRGKYGGKILRVLITGHNGYIGAILTPMVQAAGHDVTGLDTFYFGKECTFGEDVLEIPAIRKDIRDVTVEDLQGFDAIVHLAGLSNDPLGDLNPSWTYDINHMASVRLAELAKKAGVERFIHSSTCSVYGASGDKLLTEESPVHPITPYAISKIRVENDVCILADDNFSPVFLRNATAFGISPRLRGDLVFNNLVVWAFTTGRVLIMSDGTPWRPIVHIADISRAFIAALNATRDIIHNQVFNVGRTEDNYQVSELAEIVREIVPGCRVEYAEGGGPDPRCYKVDCSKIAQVLPEFKPQWDARLGAHELYTEYKRVGVTLDEFQVTKYMRVNHIKGLLDSGGLDNTMRWTRPIEHLAPVSAFPVSSETDD